MIFRRLRSDERGSLTMALLVITIGMTLSAFLAPVVVRQITSTRGLVDRNVALNAAQAGMDMMMARVRAASDEKGVSGLLERLPPCTITGDAGVQGTPEKLPYEVTIVYRDQDEAVLPCADGRGPNNVPATASLSVAGTANRVTRTLVATYIFNTSNTNIPGGSLRINTSSLGNLCIDAGSAKSPASNTRVTMQTCDGSSRQRFGYTSDLYLKLIYSETTSAIYGMCLDAGATHSTGNLVAFQPCPEPEKMPRTTRFQWSLDNNSQYHSTGSSRNVENLCINVNSPGVANSTVVLGACNSSSTRSVFRAEPGVGAGMASDDTAQLVNYDQFSRCLDVTNNSTGSSYMIAWFCKQSPDGVVNWNQQWVHPVPKKPAISAKGNIVVTNNGTPFCLRSPLNPAANAYTTVTTCSNAAQRAANNVQWTVYHDTGDYGTSYRIVDDSGYCLTPTDLEGTPKDVHSDGTSKVKVAVCNSSEAQKWNAPPNINKPTPLTDLSER